MSRRGVIVTTVVGVLVASALLVASLGAPLVLVDRPVDSDAATPAPGPIFPTLPSPTTTTTSSTGPAQGTSGLSQIFGVLLAVLAVAVTALIISLIIAALRNVFRRPVLTEHREATFSAPVPQDLIGGAGKRLELLETGEPRNAIVAAWLDLERAAGETGLPRERAETSTEYTARVIGTWEVDQTRLGDLGALYREARFSVHPLDEGHRRRAIDDLSVLHADFERVSRAQRAAALPDGSAGESS